MAVDGFVQLANDGPGKMIDNSTVAQGANTVYRQRINISDAITVNAFAVVMNTTPVGTEMGIGVRPVGPTAITGYGTGNTVQALSASVASGTGTTSNTSCAVLNVTAAGNATITFKGTFSGTFAFEVSDDGGTTWYPFMATREDTGACATTTGAISTAQVWTIACPGITHVRVRCSAITTNPCTVTIVGGGILIEPIVGATQVGTWTTGVTGYPTAAASVDALANPTITQIGADNMIYNGATWDRQRGNYDTTTGDTGAKIASFSGATQTNYNARGAYITVLCGTVSGTSPTLTAQLQWTFNGGTTWVAIGAASTAITATGNSITFVVYPTNESTGAATPAALTLGSTTSVFLNTPLPRTWRLAYTLGGTSPSFAITGVYVNYIV